MASRADPVIRAEAVRLVAEEGLTYTAAGRAVGVSFEAVRGWCLKAGIVSDTARLDLRAWEASRVSGHRSAPENASPGQGRGSGGKPALVVLFTGDELAGYRPSERDVRDPVALQVAMERWRDRVAHATAADYVERNVRSTWEASTR